MDWWTRFWAWCEGKIVMRHIKKHGATSTPSRVRKGQGDEQTNSNLKNCLSSETTDASPEHLITHPPIS